MTKNPLPDFRTEGPTLNLCEVCGARFRDWEVKPEDWALLPEAHRSLVLCEDDYRHLLGEAGHDPDKVSITHESWDGLRQRWQEQQGSPPHHTKIRLTFPRPVHGPFEAETLWCEVLEDRGNNHFVVRLRNMPLFHPAWHSGDVLLAAWDGETYHCISGRPLLRPVRRMPARKATRTTTVTGRRTR